MNKQLIFLFSFILLASSANAQLFKKFRKRPVLYVEEIVTFNKYLEHHIKYPEEAQEKNIQGRTSVAFEIDEYAKIKNIQILSQFDRECTESVVKVLKDTPKFRTKNSRLVDTNISDTITVCFRLQGTDIKSLHPEEGDVVITGYTIPPKKATTIFQKLKSQ